MEANNPNDFANEEERSFDFLEFQRLVSGEPINVVVMFRRQKSETLMGEACLR